MDLRIKNKPIKPKIGFIKCVIKDFIAVSALCQVFPFHESKAQ
ncbi:Uncharacterised protein [Mesomycoplasma hyorhinis]|nr:Uncharacterised protein [Mesomycoplasma hyorhinis]